MEKIRIYTGLFKKTFLTLIIVELLSFWGHELTIINDICFFLIIAITLYLGIKKLSWGFWIASVELIVGSFGQLFSFQLGSFTVSIRLGIFLILVIAFIYDVLKNKQIIFLKSKLWKYFLLLFSYLSIAILLGLSNNNPAKDVFFDFNGFLYFGLIFIAYRVINSWQQISKFIQLLFASVMAMTLKTLFLVFFFSHVFNESLITLVYKWVRDTRVGEIAQILDNYYRIFFQSHIWAVIAFIIISIYLLFMKKKEVLKIDYIWAWIILIASSLNIIISFSRSYWLALFITAVTIYLFLYFKEKYTITVLLKITGFFIIIIIFDLLLITGLVNVKIPNFVSSGSSVSVASLIKNRVTDSNEAAVTSRYELITPLFDKFLIKPVAGSGFGTSVTYDTDDPRVEGLYTTYTFEWGYLDLLVKIGLIGLAIYILFIYKIFKQGIRALKKTITLDAYVIVIGLLFSIILLLSVHITTPYLNHPLGIFLLIISSAIFAIYDRVSITSISRP